MESLGTTEYVAAMDLVVACIGLGETDQALTYLERAFNEGDPSVRELLADPSFDPLRSEARFQDLLRKARLTG